MRFIGFVGFHVFIDDAVANEFAVVESCGDVEFNEFAANFAEDTLIEVWAIFEDVDIVVDCFVHHFFDAREAVADFDFPF